MNQVLILIGEQAGDINIGQSRLEGRKHWMTWFYIDKKLYSQWGYNNNDSEPNNITSKYITHSCHFPCAIDWMLVSPPNSDEFLTLNTEVELLGGA